MVKKNEIYIYAILSILLLLICGGLIISRFSKDDSSSSSTNKMGSVATNKKPKKGKGRRRYSNRNIKEIVPEGVDIDIIRNNLATCKSSDTRITLLRELIGIKHPKILEIVDQELDNPDEEVRLEALELLDEFESEDIYPTLTKAMDDDSKEVRELAMEMVDTVYVPGGNDASAELICRGLNDKSEDVRDAAVNLLSDRPLYELEVVASEGIKSKHPEIKDDVLSELASRPSIRGVDIMIEGLLDKNEEFRTDVKDELEMIVDREFKSYRQAKEWWKKNQDKYEDEFAEYQDDDDDEE